MASEYELDFKAIKGAVSMEQLLVHHYKVKLTGKDHELRGVCPLPGCGSSRGLTINTAKGTGGVWKCHKCGLGGSQLDLVIAMGNAGNTKEAAIYIKQEIIDQGAAAEPGPVSATGGKEQLGAVAVTDNDNERTKTIAWLRSESHVLQLQSADMTERIQRIEAMLDKL